MSTFAHKQGAPIAGVSTSNGRPPYTSAPVRSCEKCGLFALWLLPEVRRCHHHVPDALIPLVNERAAMWAELADESWAFTLQRRHAINVVEDLRVAAAKATAASELRRIVDAIEGIRDALEGAS